MNIIISPMLEKDWPAVAEIYRLGIETGIATFAPAPPSSWSDWSKSKLNSCSLVASEGSVVLGWAALSPVSSRQVYAGVAEVSIYVHPHAWGKGLGKLLMQALVHISEQEGIWTLQSSIFPENVASLRLHEKHGFRLVGRREKIGKMESGPLKGQWLDTLLLERRSQVAGVDKEDSRKPVQNLDKNDAENTSSQVQSAKFACWRRGRNCMLA